MPIYEYECTRCGHVFEVMQSFSDKPPRQCERCSGRVRKRITAAAFHLKGSGWYVTDYKRSGSSSSKSSKPASPASTTKESTPATPPAKEPSGTGGSAGTTTSKPAPAKA